jgi:hypothetical protein
MYFLKWNTSVTNKGRSAFTGANCQGHQQTPEAVSLLPSDSIERLDRIVHIFMSYVLRPFVSSYKFDMSVCLYYA